MNLNLFFNIAVICLLLPTIIYAVILHRKLKTLKSNQEDFGKLILAFNEATIRAEAGTVKLKQLAKHAGTQLKDQVDTAKVLREDLAYFIKKADNINFKLQNNLKTLIENNNNNILMNNDNSNTNTEFNKNDNSNNIYSDDKKQLLNNLKDLY